MSQARTYPASLSKRADDKQNSSDHARLLRRRLQRLGGQGRQPASPSHGRIRGGHSQFHHRHGKPSLLHGSTQFSSGHEESGPSTHGGHHHECLGAPTPCHRQGFGSGEADIFITIGLEDAASPGNGTWTFSLGPRWPQGSSSSSRSGNVFDNASGGDLEADRGLRQQSRRHKGGPRRLGSRPRSNLLQGAADSTTSARGGRSKPQRAGRGRHPFSGGAKLVGHSHRHPTQGKWSSPDLRRFPDDRQPLAQADSNNHEAGRGHVRGPSRK